MEIVACHTSHGCGKVAVVVEDCVSAAVVGYGSFVGVALLGTSQDRIRGISHSSQQQS